MKRLFLSLLLLPVFTHAQTVGILANKSLTGVFIDRTYEYCGTYGQLGGAILYPKGGTLFLGPTAHIGFIWGANVRPLIYGGAGAGVDLKGKVGVIVEGGAGVRFRRLFLAAGYMTGSLYEGDCEGFTAKVGVKL